MRRGAKSEETMSMMSMYEARLVVVKARAEASKHASLLSNAQLPSY